MRFRTWNEFSATNYGGEAPLGGNASLMASAGASGRGSATPASDEVKRTGLQPQVDSHEIRTKQKDEQDKLMAIDAAVDRLDKDLPRGDGPKMTRFRSLWEKFRDEWGRVKASEDEPGLGDEQEDPYVTAAREHPNMVPTGPSQYGGGPGSMGN